MVLVRRSSLPKAKKAILRQKLSWMLGKTPKRTGLSLPGKEQTGLWGLHMERMERTGRRTGGTGSQEVDGPKKASLGLLILPGAVW